MDEEDFWEAEEVLCGVWGEGCVFVCLAVWALCEEEMCGGVFDDGLFEEVFATGGAEGVCGDGGVGSWGLCLHGG